MKGSKSKNNNRELIRLTLLDFCIINWNSISIIREGLKKMKNPKKLKRRHKIRLSKLGLDPSLFYVSKETADKITFVDKEGKKMEILKDK